MSTVATPITSVQPSEGLSTEVMDPEIVETPSTTEGEPSEGMSAEPEAGAEGEPEAGTEAQGGEQKEDGRLIPKWLRAMKGTDPEGYKSAKSAFFSLKEREAVHPTVQIAREEHDLVESLGGAEGANKLREDAGFFSEAANQFLKGDPAFVKDLWEEDPIAAALHVKPMLDTFKERDTEGYKSTIAQIWANDFKGVNFAPALQNLAAAIESGDKATAKSIAQSIKEWHDSILDVASRAEDPRVKTLLAERTKQHETREQTQKAEFIKSYRTESINEVVGEANKVFDSFFKNRKLSDDDRTDLLRESLSIADRAVQADKDFIAQRDKHLQRGDAHAARQLTKARYNREMTEAVKRVARRYGLVSGKTAPATQKPNQTQPRGPAITPGFVSVNARPQPEEIDRSRTSNDMIIAKRAILRDGRKVDWSKLH